MAGPADRSAYVHIPFCERVCPYCDFAVVAGRDDVASRFLAAVLREVEEAPIWGPLDAIYVGGGTPSRFVGIVEIVGALSDRLGLAPGAEVTLEANPEDWSPELARRLRDGGFNRVSFGVQSFDSDVLTALGRRHRPGQALRAIADARDAGIRSISVDLIYGTPGETVASWRTSLEQAVESGADHISTYALTVEPPTELGRAVRAGAAAPDPDDQADKWELAADLLGAAGYLRYEVSNHARPGHACRYNLGVWHRGEYLAFGMGAHGYRDGVRTRHVRRLDTYLDRVERGIGPVQAADRIEGWAAEQERLMLGLRLAEGVTAGPGGVALLGSAEGRRLREAGVLAVAEVDGRAMLRVDRPLLTDAAIRIVLGLEPPPPLGEPAATPVP